MIVLNNTILSVFKRLDETNLLKELLLGEVLLPTAVVKKYLEIEKESELKGFTKIKAISRIYPSIALLNRSLIQRAVSSPPLLRNL